MEEPLDWIAENINGYFPSFYLHWKKVEKELTKKHSNQDD